MCTIIKTPLRVSLFGGGLNVQNILKNKRLKLRLINKFIYIFNRLCSKGFKYKFSYKNNEDKFMQYK